MPQARCVDCEYFLRGDISACNALNSPNENIHEIFNCKDFSIPNHEEVVTRRRELEKKIVISSQNQPIVTDNIISYSDAERRYQMAPWYQGLSAQQRIEQERSSHARPDNLPAHNPSYRRVSWAEYRQMRNRDRLAFTPDPFLVNLNEEEISRLREQIELSRLYSRIDHDQGMWHGQQQALEQRRSHPVPDEAECATPTLDASQIISSIHSQISQLESISGIRPQYLLLGDYTRVSLVNHLLSFPWTEGRFNDVIERYFGLQVVPSKLRHEFKVLLSLSD